MMLPNKITQHSSRGKVQETQRIRTGEASFSLEPAREDKNKVMKR